MLHRKARLVRQSPAGAAASSIRLPSRTSAQGSRRCHRRLHRSGGKSSSKRLPSSRSCRSYWTAIARRRSVSPQSERA